jgi:hypothetical protein
VADLIQLLQVNRKAIQEAAAKAAVLARRRDGTLETDHAAEDEFRRLLGLINSSSEAVLDSIKSAPLQLLSSELWNRYQDALLVDLRTIYEILGTIESTSKQMDQVVSSDLSTTKAGILTAINQLRVHEFLKEYPEYQDLKILDFVRSVNNSKRLPKAVIDGNVRMLELPAKLRDVVSLAKNGDRVTTTSTTHYGGGTAGGFGPDFGSEKAIDTNPRTFWAEVISHTGPIQIDVPTSWGATEAMGVVGELIVNLGKAVLINNIRLLPFSEFPYSIIDVAYQEGSNSSEWHTLPGFKIIENADDWVEIDTPAITISRLKILIEQPNYTRATYNIPKSLIHNEAIWSQIQSNVYSKEIHEIDLSSDQEGTVKVEPEQLAYLSALGLVDSRLRKLSIGQERKDVTRDLSQLFTNQSEAVESLANNTVDGVANVAFLGKKPTDDTNIQVTRYEYLYGIRQLELSLVTYQPIGYYESQPLDTNGNLISVELETDEKHVEFNDGLGNYRRTSIEYEVEVAPGVRFPIVSLTELDGANYAVKDEYLTVKNGRATLRFTPSAGSIRVRENGLRVPTGHVTVSGKTVTISEVKRGAVYTASYHVDEESTVAQIDGNLSSTRVVQPEVFNGTSKDNSVKLAYYPYVVYEIVRDRNHWEQPDETVALWDWSPEFFPVSHGTVALTNGSKVVTLTQDDAADPDFGDLIDDDDYENKIYIRSTGETLAVDNVSSNLTLNLVENYDGTTASGLEYIVGRTLTHDGKVWGLNLRTYEPIRVFVDGEKTYNVTDYYNLVQPAFSGSSENNRIEFVQAGKTLFFNQPLVGRKIEVQYSWLIQYLKLRATLRSNVPVNTILTPKLDSARLRVKNTTL